VYNWDVDDLKQLEEEMIRLEDEIDVAAIAATISPSPQQEQAFRAEVARLTGVRDAVKEERRKLKYQLRGH
jgi:hypothetical protein